jgi:hypothetical protein
LSLSRFVRLQGVNISSGEFTTVAQLTTAMMMITTPNQIGQRAEADMDGFLDVWRLGRSVNVLRRRCRGVGQSRTRLVKNGAKRVYSAR